MIDLFLQGGPFFMLPLLAASIGVIAIAIERVVRYRAAEVDPADLREAIAEAITEEGLPGGIRCAESVPGPVARVWSEGLRHAQLPLPLLRERLEGAATSELARLERHLPHLDIVAQLAPLIGILGTVWGMMAAFRGIAGGLAAGSGIDGETLTGGIAQALITTGAGLVVAIPAAFIHHLLRQRVERFVTSLEEAIRDVVLTVSTRSARVATRAGSSATTAAR